jgi:hypothetical protein
MAEVAIQDFRTIVLANQTVTTSGSAVFTGYGAAELVLVINVTGTVSGTTPTLTFTVQEVDPGNQTTLIGPTFSGAAITAVGTQTITIPTMVASCVQVSWAVGGTTPSFGGVYATLVNKLAGTSELYGTSGVPAFGTAGSPGATAITIQGITNGTSVPVTITYTDRTSTGTITSTQNVAVNTQGSASTGVEVTGTWTGTLSFQATVDGTNWVAVNAIVPVTGVEVTSTTANGNWEIPSAGYQQVRVLGNTVATGTATVTLDSGVGAQVVEIGAPLPTGSNTIGAVNQGTAAALSGAWPFEITDGTHGPVAVKAPNTAAVAADPALVVAISPNNSITLSASDVTATGALGALNAAVQITTAGLSGVGMQLAAGTLIGTITPQISYDGGTTWSNTFFQDPTTLAITQTVVFASANGATAKSILGDTGSGLTRVTVTAYTSGTANVTLRASDMYDPAVPFQAPVASATPPVVAVIGGSDGTLARALSTDTSGRPIVVGPAAGGAAIVGNPVLFAPLTDNALVGEFAFGEANRLRVGSESLEFLDTFDGTTVNTVRWAQSTSGLVQAQTQTSFSMNSTSVVTANAYSILTSNKSFLLNGEFAVQTRIKAKLTAQTNATIELGFLAAATNAAPTNGVFFRITSAGTQELVINFNGTETTSVIATALTAANYYTFVIYVYGTIARLDILNWDNSVFATTTLQTPATQGALIQTGHIPAAIRVYNGGTAPGTAANAILTSVTVEQLDLSTNSTWGEQLASASRSGIADPLTGVQLQNFSNSTAPSTIATTSLSNTTAAYTTLGGLFAFNTPASAETDYLLFAYQVPTGFTLVIWSIQIATFLMGAQSTTTPTLLQWGLAVGSSAASLATAGANPPVRTAIGMQQAPKSANLGDPFTPGIIQYTPKVPIVCFGGKYVQVILRVPLGNVTAGQINRGMVTLDAMLQ